MPQGIRPSQYITTFGPGSLIETPSGPHVLESTDSVIGRITQLRMRMDDLAIRDIRLQSGLLNGARIFKLPDEAVNKDFRHPARRFPLWNLCVEHRDENIIHYSRTGCPRCGGRSHEESKKARHAIRFLVACPRGHIDDVNWNFLVHVGARPAQPTICQTNHLIWRGTGSSLSSIVIQCPVCGANKTLGNIYQSCLRCSGKRPETDAPAEDCSESAIVVQRGSFQIRLPEVITSLTIPPLTKAIHQTLQRDDVGWILSSLREFGLTEDNFRRMLARAETERRIPPAVIDELRHQDWVSLSEALREIESVRSPKTVPEYLQQEHTALEFAAEQGYPPYPSEGERRPGEPPLFQVNAAEIDREVTSTNGKIVFRVVPIERLRVVLVQTGYKRVKFSGPTSHLHPVHAPDPTNPEVRWYPGVDHYGEGIYIDINPSIRGQDHFYPIGRAAHEWDDMIARNPRAATLIEWNALSAWWHSLAHRLINAVSIHSGYSSSAIRERIYLTRDQGRGLRGGIILYTAQSGGDGTMGGLTSLVPYFREILDLALDGLDRCSNDPLCENADLDPISNLGAACYSCLMVSETSCEHFNGHLNRRLLLENLA